MRFSDRLELDYLEFEELLYLHFGDVRALGLGHVLDCTVIIDYGEARDPLIKSELDVKHGTFVRIFRVLGCRLCGFDGNYHEIEITKNGFVRKIEGN